MSTKFKKPGVLRASFAYQDLIGIEALLRMYRDPMAYAWIKLDAVDDPAFVAVDDIVVCRSDGLYELIQVKFTPDPNKPSAELSWDWLLKSSGPKATSFLQKWAKTTNAHIAAGSLGSAALRTDRKPDLTFTGCLSGRRINYDLVPQTIRNRIEAQVGGESEARRFFGHFEFQHSEKQLADLEYQLKARVVPADTDEAGWSKLVNAAWTWATWLDHPRTGGRIVHADLTQIINRQAPRPIPQDFRVPDGYAVPNNAFHDAFIASLSGQDGVRVLWGAPGRGKSTYLSYCAKARSTAAEVWIRHHFFLSLTDTTTTQRFYFHEIARSLVSQIRAGAPKAGVSESSELRAAITQAARHLGNIGGRLVLVIDGLDHVWREQRSHEQMAQLFSTILPLPANVSLVVGTQKVPDKELPPSLLQALPKEQWTELPLMSRNAVSQWLAGQHKAGRLQVADEPPKTQSAQITALANAFYKISGGLPLHLIYSFEALVRRGGPISPGDAATLPPCPDGDIRTYYRTLWSSIDARAREMLHVLAGVQFAFPDTGLRQLFGHSALEAEAIAQIDHLLERRQTGVLPFHGSIFAFVREIADHLSVFQAHGAAILKWLEETAPPYWRWAWLWITQAQLGAPQFLLTEPTRPWVIAAMANGYPLDQIMLILEQAETLAFEAMDLPRVFELRSLHTRLANAPEFQMHDMSPFIEAATTLSSDEFPRLRLRDNLTAFDSKLMLVALAAMDGPERAPAARKVLTELGQRAERQRKEGEFGSSQRDFSHEVMRAAALAGDLDPKRVVRYARAHQSADTLMAAYAREALHAGEPATVIAIAAHFDGREFARELTAAMCADGLTAQGAGLPLSHGRRPLIRAWCALKGAPFGVNPTRLELKRMLGPAERNETYHPGTRATIHDVFFSAFSAALVTPAATTEVRWPKAIRGEWLEDLFRDLIDLAAAISDAWRSHGVAPSLAAFYTGLSVKRPYRQDYGGSREVSAARLGLCDIAFDLQVLATGLDPRDRITLDDIASVAKSTWWEDELWRDACAARRLPIHTPEGAAAFAAKELQHLDTTVMDFAERAAMATKLATFASDNGAEDLARAELTRAADCLIGYGWRKDLFAFEVLHAIEHLLTANHPAAPGMVLEIAAPCDAITEYTDGDETDHVRSNYYGLLARVFPDRGASCYHTLLEQEDWRYADELLREAAKTLPEDIARAALLRTFVQPDEFNAVASLADSGRDGGVLTHLNQINGQASSTKKRRTRRDRSGPYSSSRRGRPIDVTKFPATDLPALLARLRKRKSYSSEAETIIAWLDHWEAQGQALAALAQLSAHIDAKQNLTMFDRTLDAAFKLSLRVQGRSKAFAWAVLAHRHRYGWQRWFTSQEDTIERLDLIAKEYPSRWKEFVIATSEPTWSKSGERRSRVIGMERLVYFLVAVGQLEIAEAYVRRMIKVLIDEVSNQPLKTPVWAA